MTEADQMIEEIKEDTIKILELIGEDLDRLNPLDALTKWTEVIITVMATMVSMGAGKVDQSVEEKQKLVELVRGDILFMVRERTKQVIEHEGHKKDA